MSATTNTPALPAPLIVDYQATIGKLTKAVKDYNAATGDVLAERIRQQHLHTLLRLWDIYFGLYHKKPQTQPLPLKMLVNGSGIKAQVAQSNVKTFDEHIKRLELSGFVARGTDTGERQIRRAGAGNQEVITLLHPECLTFREPPPDKTENHTCNKAE